MGWVGVWESGGGSHELAWRVELGLLHIFLLVQGTLLLDSKVFHRALCTVMVEKLFPSSAKKVAGLEPSSELLPDKTTNHRILTNTFTNLFYLSTLSYTQL
ncbi:hypothetical protein VTL71DRAFT_2562 [Oculimacula yallundae]|uniref:Uncharacterized protein n=1 Tax=Oculimacula yallundae TaxID=86028 RepID=A0ABR4C996_9HELO